MFVTPTVGEEVRRLSGMGATRRDARKLIAAVNPRVKSSFRFLLHTRSSASLPFRPKRKSQAAGDNAEDRLAPSKRKHSKQSRAKTHATIPIPLSQTMSTSAMQQLTRRILSTSQHLRPRRARSGRPQCTRVSTAAAPARRTVTAAHSNEHVQPIQVFPSHPSVDALPFDFNHNEENTTTLSPNMSTPATSASVELPVFQRDCSVLEVVSDVRVLKAVARMKLLGLPSQVDGTLPAPFRASALDSTVPASDVATADDVDFCSESLDQVSRSFAAVIRQLPESLALPTCAFYLVLRALDTVEDEMDFSKFSAASKMALHGSATRAQVASDPLLFKTTCLLNFHNLLEGTDAAASSWETLNALNSCDVGAGNDQMLLQSFDRVVRIVRDHCTAEQQQIIADVTRQMASGMAEYCQRDLGVNGTDSRGDYNKYCHIVAGLVGEGLSKLWCTAEDSGLSQANLAAVNARTGLGSLSSDMGLFLQKTNIVRDYAEDQVDGRAFWPKDIWSKFSPNGQLGAFRASKDNYSAGLACLNTMVNDALALAPSCFNYLQHLASGDSRILRFCAIPQVMALATLAECYGNPRVFEGIVKTPKTQSARICCEVGDMEGVLSWYTEVCDDIEHKVDAWERSDSFHFARDAAVASQTRSRLLLVREAVQQAQGTSLAPAREEEDDEDYIPENWPCGPHAEGAYMDRLLTATH